MNAYHLIFLLQTICLVSGSILISKLIQHKKIAALICISNYMAINIIYMFISYTLLNSNNYLSKSFYILVMSSSVLQSLLLITVPVYVNSIIKISKVLLILFSVFVGIELLFLVHNGPLNISYRYNFNLDFSFLFSLLLDIYLVFIILKNLKKINLKRDKFILKTILCISLVHCAFIILNTIYASKLNNITVSIYNSAPQLIAITLIFIFITTLLNFVYNAKGKSSKEINFDDYQLSSREVDVIKLLLIGDSNKDISDKLNISESTIKTHCSRIYRKTGVNSKFQLITKFG